MRHALSRMTIFTAVLVAPVATWSQTPDTVFVNGKVFTSDGRILESGGFAVRGGRFVAVGENVEMRRMAGPQTQLVDLKGRFVAPGLTDAHFHSEGGGPNLDLSKVRTLAELLASVRSAAAKAKLGEVIVSNRDWHEMQLSDQRLPLASELDTVAPNNPVVLRRGGHSYILNSAALKKWDIDANTISPAGGAISKDADGRLTGELFDNAKRLVDLPLQQLSIEDVFTTQRVLNSYGITSVRVIGSYKTSPAAPYSLFDAARKTGKLTARFNIFLRNPEGGRSSTADEYIAGLERQGVAPGIGDDWVRVGGIKLIVDGGFEGGHYFQPYAEPYGKGGTYRGVVVTPPALFKELVKKLNRKGWTITTHAAGDAGVAQVLDAYEEANLDSSIVGKKWAIEHAFLSSDDQMARIKNLGVTLSLQDHLMLAGPAFKKYLGSERAAKVTPLKSYLARDVKVALGTDADVIPINPYWQLHHYLTRMTLSDGVYGPDEAVSDRAKLLELLTAGYAELTGEADRKGKIKPGHLADFVILSDDYMTIPLDAVRDLRALATYVNGHKVYNAADTN